MGITYFAGDVIRQLAADAKPSVDDGYLLIETDTGKLFIRDAGVWTEIVAGGGGIHDQADHEQDLIPQNAGRPATVAENDAWLDTAMKQMVLRLVGRDHPVPLFIPGRLYMMAPARGSGTVGLQTFGCEVTETGTVENSRPEFNTAFTTARRYTTGVVSGNEAGVQALGVNEMIVWRGGEPWLALRFRLNETTSVRAFFGITSLALATSVGSDDPAGHYAAMQFSTPRSDTNWQFVSDDGTTQEKTDSGVAPDTGWHTLYIRIDEVDDEVIFQLNEGNEVVHSTNIPGASTDLGVVFAIETQTAATRRFWLPIWYLTAEPN